MMKKLVSFLLYLAVIAAVKVTGLFPRGFFFFLAPFVARILYLFPQMGRVSMQNLAVVFPEKSKRERRQIALGSLGNLYLSIAEFFWSKGKSKDVLNLIDSPENAQSIAHAGHNHPVPGAVFITPHLGNWEFGGMYLAMSLGFRVATVVRTARNPYIDKLLSSGRMVEGVELLQSKGAALGMAHALKSGRTVGVLIDQNTRVRDGGSFVNFFGLPVPVSMAPAHLARRDGRFVVIGACFRTGRRYSIVMKTLPKPSNQYDSDEALTQDLMNLTMDLIRMHPEQYLWMYKRFQNIPRDCPEDIRKKYPSYASVAPEKFYSSKAKFQRLDESGK